ncbi:MAG: hypothetical protein IJR96_03870 [Pseudobutyrivibrio sp.]|nr:hypothetical protein [Pseudobutyrivibrio sp.]
MGETKICKYCKTDIPKDAKICPNCRKKQKGKLGIIIAVVIVLLLIGCVAGSGSDSSKSDTASTSSTTSTGNSASSSDVAETEEEIEYIQVSKEELSDALQGNALKASDTYKDKYLEISGYLDVIDSSGKYISINSGDDDFSFLSVQCYIKNDDQKATIMDMSRGDALIIKGKCTDVGELMGYSIDIDEIIVN